jgi:hypothetical protein
MSGKRAPGLQADKLLIQHFNKCCVAPRRHRRTYLVTESLLQRDVDAVIRGICSSQGPSVTPSSGKT